METTPITRTGQPRCARGAPAIKWHQWWRWHSPKPPARANDAYRPGSRRCGLVHQLPSKRCVRTRRRLLPALWAAVTVRLICFVIRAILASQSGSIALVTRRKAKKWPSQRFHAIRLGTPPRRRPTDLASVAGATAIRRTRPLFCRTASRAAPHVFIAVPGKSGQDFH